MKDYNEMAKAVFERRDEYLAEKKRKQVLLLKAGVPVCSLLLVSLLGVTIWMAKMPDIPSAPMSDKQNITQNVTEPAGSENDITNFVPATQETVIAKPSQGAQSPAPDNTLDGAENPVVKPTAISPDSDYKPQTGATKPQGDSAADSVRPRPTGVVNVTVPGVPSTMPCTNAGSEIPEPPTEGDDPYIPQYTQPPCTTCAPTEAYPMHTEPVIPATTPPTTEAPTEPPTGPLEIKLADKTYIAQTGDMVTYTVELEAEENFETIQMRLDFDGNYLSAIVPKDAYDDSGIKKSTPNLVNSVIGYHRDTVRMNAICIDKFDFEDNKILMTVNFTVNRAGRIEIKRVMEEMCIYCDQIIDGNLVYWETRHYFAGSRPEVTYGITFTEYLTITPAAEITPS